MLQIQVYAWVGFLQSDGKKAWWNFNAGRYPEYQGVRGILQDPQTRHIIADSSVSLLADLIHAPETRSAVCCGSNGWRAGACISFMKSGRAMAAREAFRACSSSNARLMSKLKLDLLEAALRACPGYAPAWIAVRDLAQNGALTLDQKKKWAQVLHRLCAERYPEFELAILEPMIATVEDVDEQNKLWNAAFNSMGKRVDLAAEVRMAQAAMWKDAGQPQKAGRCYEDVIVRYANAGPFIVGALREAEKISDRARRAAARGRAV